MRSVLLCLMVLCCVASAGAGELAGVRMPETTLVSGSPLSLSGMALRRVVFFKVYVAGLYLAGEPGSAEQVLADDAPRRMVLHFLREVDAADLSKAWMEGLEANTPQPTAEVQDAFEALCGWMTDVAEGDEMEVTYEPGAGTSIALHGQPKGTLSGKAFADALFACWIGPKPGPGKAFREDLLGG